MDRTSRLRKVIVPDTLDLADRAELALHGMAGILDPEADYEFWWWVIYTARPAYMVRDFRSFPVCGPKVLESFPMLLSMTGCTRYDEQFHGLKRLLTSWIAEDGLMYAPIGPKRFWDTVCPENYAPLAGQPRMMLAMMALHQFDGDPAWLDLIAGMAKGMARVAIDKGDYAYYPVNMPSDGRMREGYCYPKSGWYDTSEATNEAEGFEGSMFMYHCAQIRALSRWHKTSGDEGSIRLAGKLARYVMREKYWGAPYDWPKPDHKAIRPGDWWESVVGHDRGHWSGHFHGHTAMLFALLEYADAANDNRLKEFVRSGYEFTRNFGLARVGVFGETCAISDMVAIAVKLSEYGVGDYWDDVDGYARNQLVEQQLVNASHLRRVSEAGCAPEEDGFGFWKADPRYGSKENVIERTLGVFSNVASLAEIRVPISAHCCTGNGTQALYYAWESIVRETSTGHVQVNLLLNRVTPWVDIASYLPYEGKVVLHNTTASSISLRVPGCVSRPKLACTVNGKQREFVMAGNYAVLTELGPGDEITFEFPVTDETITYTNIANQFSLDPHDADAPVPAKYDCRFRGNTLVDISPRPSGALYPLYERGHMKATTASLKEVERFVSPVVIKW